MNYINGYAVGGWHRSCGTVAAHFGDGHSKTPEEKGFKIDTYKDLMPIVPAVMDQGQVGSCVFNAGATLYESERQRAGLPFINFSRMFFYNVTRSKIMGVPLEDDSGSTTWSMALCAETYGLCSETLFPYTMENFLREPPPECYAEARGNRVLRYYSLRDLQWVKACLTLEHLVCFGMLIDDSFMKTGIDGNIAKPQPGAIWKGGHEMTIIGFDDVHLNANGSRGAFRIMNSWGTSWADGGFAWLGYDHAALDLCGDFGCFHEVTK